MENKMNDETSINLKSTMNIFLNNIIPIQYIFYLANNVIFKKKKIT